MREDMFNVIVERPRRGGWDRGARPSFRHVDLEDGGPSHESVRHRHSDRKGLNENLRPLERYFERSVGRHWDKVYAEVCERLSPRSTVQQHVRDHIGDFVAIRTGYIGGQLHDLDHRGWPSGPKPIADSFCRFYVHPVSKVLMANRHQKSWKQVQRQNQAAHQQEILARRRDLSPDTQLHRIAGHWYEISLARNEGDVPRGIDAVIDRGFSRLDPLALYGRKGVYAAAKRQLGRAELEQFGLR